MGKPDPREKLHWDEAILYAPHSKWEDAPTPAFWRGPVYRVIPDLDTAIGEAASVGVKDPAESEVIFGFIDKTGKYVGEPSK